jgi:hypothetical protein
MAKFRTIWGRFFVPFFRGKSLYAEFLGKTVFQNFSAENSFFSQHFWGKFFREIFRGIFPVKKCTKNRPLKPIVNFNATSNLARLENKITSLDFEKRHSLLCMYNASAVVVLNSKVMAPGEVDNHNL